MGPSLLLICCSGLLAQGTAVHKPAITNPRAVSKSTEGQPASWRKLLDSESATLGQVRGVFLNQRVTVDGAVDEWMGQSGLLEWRIAFKPVIPVNVPNPEVQKVFDHMHMPYVVQGGLDLLPDSYSGKEARVIAVQLHSSDKSGPKTNALGEPISDDETINPNFDLVVQLDDGTIAMTTQYPSTLTGMSVVELASVAKATAEQMTRELSGIVGNTVYAVGFSRLYRPDTTLDEITKQDAFKRVSTGDVPLLKPLKIVAAKYVDSAGVVIKVKLPSGADALSLTSKLELQIPPSAGVERTFFEWVIGSLLAKIPSSLTKKDLDAIRSGTIYRGMKEESVEYAMGLPDKENDWGSGGKQLIYGKSFLVYVDRQETVVDWQSLDDK